jgi:hypothetical protein
LLVLVSRDDVAALGDFHAAGATHFLASPFTELEFAQALRFAWRFVERIAGDWDRGRAVDLLGWRYNRRTRRVRLTPALGKRLDLGEEIPLDTALRALPPDDRAAAAAAVGRPRSRTIIPGSDGWSTTSRRRRAIPGSTA